MTYDKCPKCGGEIHQEKHTFTGRQIREYDCLSCDWSDIVDEGPALWVILSDFKEEDNPR